MRHNVFFPFNYPRAANDVEQSGLLRNTDVATEVRELGAGVLRSYAILWKAPSVWG